MSVTVFFDLDGTLCRPRTQFRSVFIATCAPLLNMNAWLDPQRLLGAWGMALEAAGPATTGSCLTHALQGCAATVPHELLAACAAALNGEWARAQELNTGAGEVLDALRACSVPMGIITNGPSDAQRAVISALGLDAACRWIVVSGDTGVGVRKPAAGIFLYALAASQARAHETWYVGDSAANDVAGAARVGMRTCWLCGDDATLPEGVPEPSARISALPGLVSVLAR